MILKQKYFFLRNPFFCEEFEFLNQKNIVIENYILVKSSRMVKVIFYADSKSTSRIIFPPRKSGDMGWSKFVQKSTYLTFCSHIYANPSFVFSSKCRPFLIKMGSSAVLSSPRKANFDAVPNPSA